MNYLKKQKQKKPALLLVFVTDNRQTVASQGPKIGMMVHVCLYVVVCGAVTLCVVP